MGSADDLTFPLMLSAQADWRAGYHQLLENDYVRVSSLEVLAGPHAPAENLWDLVALGVSSAPCAAVVPSATFRLCGPLESEV